MGNLIDDLLAFSGIGRAESKATTVDLQQRVKEVVSEIGQQTKGKDISWTISGTSSLLWRPCAAEASCREPSFQPKSRLAL